MAGARTASPLRSGARALAGVLDRERSSDRVEATSFAEIAEREAQGERHIRLLVPLAFLSPRIVVAIVNGTAPADLTVSGLAKDRELQPVDFP
jgi:hypothetical protein